MDYRKRILFQVEEEEREMGKFTLYLPVDLYDYFRAKCGEHPASTVVEAMMRDFCGLKAGEKPPKTKKGKG